VNITERRQLMKSPTEYEAEFEKFEMKIADLEIKIEEMEFTNCLVSALLVGGLSFYEWHSWLLSIGAAFATYVISWKFIAKKTFTKNITRH